MNRYVWAVWEKGQSVSQLEIPVQDVIFDYVMHCEAMSWRMLEFACEHYEARK